MKTLAEFLRVQREKERAEEAQFGAKRRGWEEAIQRLLAQLRSWIEDADAEHTLNVTEFPVSVYEEELGRWSAQGLAMVVGLTEVRIVPIACNVLRTIDENGRSGIRAQGRVDLTNDVRKYLLYRLITDGGDRWVIAEDDGDRVEPLTRSTFEAALVSLLQ